MARGTGAASKKARVAEKALSAQGSGAYEFVSLLGIGRLDPLAIIRRVSRGLGFDALEHFQRKTRLSTNDLAEVVAIKPRTLHRRKRQGRLAPEESDRLVRFSRVFGKALQLFEGDSDVARRWLSTRLEALGGERPIALAKTDVGAREVEALIDRLEHGVLT